MWHVWAGGGPWRVTIAPGCRSGAVVFPCLGRGMCLRSGRCKCSDGYLGSQCHIACPGLSDDGTYCSGRGNCSAVSLTSSSSPKVQEEAAREASVSLGGGGGADMDVELGMCTCQYGAPAAHYPLDAFSTHYPLDAFYLDTSHGAHDTSHPPHVHACHAPHVRASTAVLNEHLLRCLTSRALMSLCGINKANVSRLLWAAVRPGMPRRCIFSML